MSKLFDQLKNATRSREEKSPGLLLEALQRSQQRDPNTAAETAPAVPPAADTVAPAPSSVAPAQAGAQSPEIGPRPSAAIAAAGATSAAEIGPRPSAAIAAAGATRASPYAGIGLAAVILAVAWLAWNAAPWRAPQKVKIDPAALKLDRGFQLDRPSPKGTTPPPSRS